MPAVITSKNTASRKGRQDALRMLVGVTVCALCAERCRAESRDVYEIATATALAVLPEPLHTLLEQHLGAITKTAIGELGQDESSAFGPREEHRHYVMLDIDAANMKPAARATAVSRFPHERAVAKRLFKQQQASHGGSLPWVIVQRFRALVRAFRASDREAVLVEVGRLLHFATDAALPFHTTADRDGAQTGQLIWPAETATLADRRHRTVRLRCEVVLVELLRQRFDYEVRVWPQRWEPSSDPLADVFVVLVDAHGALAELIRIDTDLTTALDLRGAGSFVVAANLYYAELMKRAGPIMEVQLEAGALLGANLVGSAWIEAGRPALDFESASAPARPTRTSAPAGESPTPRYVGSRNSKLFHVPDCSHARRIKPENRVDYGSLEQTRRAGRAPCRTCKPDAP